MRYNSGNYLQVAKEQGLKALGLFPVTCTLLNSKLDQSIHSWKHQHRHNLKQLTGSIICTSCLQVPQERQGAAKWCLACAQRQLWQHSTNLRSAHEAAAWLLPCSAESAPHFCCCWPVHMRNSHGHSTSAATPSMPRSWAAHNAINLMGGHDHCHTDCGTQRPWSLSVIPCLRQGASARHWQGLPLPPSLQTTLRIVLFTTLYPTCFRAVLAASSGKAARERRFSGWPPGCNH